MAEELMWNRFTKLPLSAEEKGRIYAQMKDEDLAGLKKLLPDFLEDEAIASSLREQYLKRRPPEGLLESVNNKLEGYHGSCSTPCLPNLNVIDPSEHGQNIISMMIVNASSAQVILSHLGTGATSDVYSVSYKHKVVAKKCYKVGCSPENEAKILKRLSGVQGIPTVLKVGCTESNNYLLMEPVGASIKDIHHLTAAQRNVISSVVDILHEAHKRNLVHRDIRLPNLLFVGDEQGPVSLLVIDWGFATDVGAPTRFAGNVESGSDGLLLQLIEGRKQLKSPKSRLFEGEVLSHSSHARVLDYGVGSLTVSGPLTDLDTGARTMSQQSKDHGLEIGKGSPSGGVETRSGKGLPGVQTRNAMEGKASGVGVQTRSGGKGQPSDVGGGKGQPSVATGRNSRKTKAKSSPESMRSPKRTSPITSPESMRSPKRTQTRPSSSTQNDSPVCIVQPKDDLISLVRTLLLFAVPQRLMQLRAIYQGDYQGYLDFWANVMQEHKAWVQAQSYAEACDYEQLKNWIDNWTTFI